MYSSEPLAEAGVGLEAILQSSAYSQTLQTYTYFISGRVVFEEPVAEFYDVPYLPVVSQICYNPSS